MKTPDEVRPTFRYPASGLGLASSTRELAYPPDLHSDPPPDVEEREFNEFGEVVQAILTTGQQIGKSLHSVFEMFKPIIGASLAANNAAIRTLVEEGLVEIAPVMENLRVTMDHIHHAHVAANPTEAHNCPHPSCTTSKRYPGVVEAGKKKRPRKL